MTRKRPERTAACNGLVGASAVPDAPAAGLVPTGAGAMLLAPAREDGAAEAVPEAAPDRAESASASDTRA